MKDILEQEFDILPDLFGIINRNHRFLGAADLAENVLVGVLTDRKSDLDRRLEPIVLAKLAQRRFPIVGRLTVAQKDDTGSKIAHRVVTEKCLS